LAVAGKRRRSRRRLRRGPLDRAAPAADHSPVPAIVRTRVWPRFRRWTVGAGLALAALVTVAGLLGWALVQESPVWWRTVRRDDPRTAETALLVENSVWNQIHHRRAAGGPPGGDPAPEVAPGAEWTVSLKASDANAWLNARLPLWLANQHEEAPWPKELAEVQVDFGDGLIRVGARVNSAGQDRVLSATLLPDLRDDGTLWLPATWISIGRLAVPADWLLEQAEQHQSDFIPPELRQLPETLAMFRGFAGAAPMVQNAVIKLEDGRRVRLLKLRPVNGRLEITCRTERRGELATAPTAP
jgi:hypothetical protein